MSEQEDTLIEFPCDFTIKAMGKTGPELHETIITIGHRHDPEFDVERITTRASKNGNFTSMTINVYAQNKPHLDAIYLDLTASEHILWAL
ncbi:YbeD family protein [Leucothrix mucor]|uniref:YbeD family protein n=1 Tax=Leucothrix mucor TaxID=45248 RepID=UPI0003B593B4|nr:DUF493 domain-containing protein [Leucothrix mucor]